MRSLTIAFTTVLLLVFGAPVQVVAQGWFGELSVGAVLPQLGMSELRNPGPRLTASVGYGFGRHIAVRGDFATFLMPGVAPPSGSGGEPYGDLRSFEFSVNGVVRLPREGPSIYLVAGAGGYDMQILGIRRNPYGVVPGLSAGAGVDFRIGHRTVFSEARWKLMLSDYGAGDFEPGIYVPLVVGVRF